jgi:wobble nucleotide-excising tRNase
VLFRGQAVAEPDLDKIFSESDRRSLSLAIFLSSLDTLAPAELAKTVVVLDDPVTSFDDHRVGQTHRKLVELADRCEQLILLSHFKDGVANFLTVHGFSRRDIRLIEIVKDAESSKLQLCDPEVFIKSAHQLNTDELIDFIERRTDKLSCKPRVYLEDAIKLRFSKQIRQHEVCGGKLSDRIDDLEHKAVVPAEVAQALHRWRVELNPEHHTWLGDDIENQRNTVAEFLDFVFHQLVPVQ